VLEASVIGALGMIAAFAVYAVIVAGVATIIQAQTGVRLDVLTWNPVMAWAPLGMIALCALGGLLPAWKAYRTDVAAHLAPVS
jgi:putative ABC transport system permease protein